MKVGFDKNVLQMETPMANIGVQQKLQVIFSQIVIEIRDLASVGATAPTYIFRKNDFAPTDSVTE